MQDRSPALTYLASIIGKQLNENHFTVESVHYAPSRLRIFSRPTDEDIQKGFETDLEKQNKAHPGAVPKISKRMGEVPKAPLSALSEESTFAFRVFPKLLPVGTAGGIPVKNIGNIEEYIVTSLLTGEISSGGMKFSKCGAVFNQRTKEYDLFRKESEQPDRYFYTDPVQMQEVLYKTVANAKAAGFSVDENRLSQELAKQAKKLSEYHKNLETLISLEPGPGKKIDPAQEAIISAGYLESPKVACHINGKKLGPDRHNPIVKQYVDGVQEQLTGAAKVANAIRDNAELNSSLSVPVVKPIEEFLKNSKLKVGAKDFIIWAKDKGIQLPYKGKLVDPTFYAAQVGRLIDGQDPIAWAVKNTQKIEGLDAGLWAVKNDTTIHGQDAMEWLAKDAVTGKKEISEEILSLAITKNKKIDGMEVFQWMAENNLMVKRDRDILPMDALVWARIQHLKDPIKMPEDPYDWAMKNDKISKIDGKDKFLFMIEDIHNIEKQNPIVWCINHKKPIDGKDALQWVKDNASHQGVQDFYKHLVMFSGQNVARIEDKDSVVWIIEQGLQPGGKDVIKYLEQYPDFTGNEHPVKWLIKKPRSFDYVEYAFNEDLQIDNMHPVEWAKQNEFPINPEIEHQYKAQQFQAEVERVAGLGSIGQKAAIIEAAYGGKQDLLNALAGRKIDVYTPLAEEYVELKSSAAPDKEDKRKRLETAYEGVLRAQGKNPLGTESSVGKLVFSNTMETLVRNFKHVSSRSKNKLPMKGELIQGLQSEAILQKYTLPVIEKVHEIGQAIAKTDREKPKGIKGTLQKCADWFASIFAQNIKSEAIKAARVELIGEVPLVKADKTKTGHAENVVEKRAVTSQTTSLGT